MILTLNYTIQYITITITKGTIEFSKQNTSFNSGLEGGSMSRKGDAVYYETETVPMITLDEFIHERLMEGDPIR